MFKRLFQLHPYLYITLTIAFVGFLFGVARILSIGSPLFMNDSWHVVQEVVLEEKSFSSFFVQHGPHHFGLAGWLHAVCHLLGLENARVHAILELGILAISGILATATLVQWRGKWRLNFIWIPLIFMLPGVWLSALTAPHVHSFTVLFALFFTWLSTGYMTRVKLLVACLALFLAAFTFNAVLVVVAVGLFHVIHWYITRWYTSGIIAGTAVLITTVVMFTTAWKGVEGTSAEGIELMQGAGYFFTLLTSFMADRPYTLTVWFAIPVSLFLLYVLVHPWIRTRHRNRHEFGILLLLLVLGLYWLLNTLTRGDSALGNAYALRYQPMIALLLFTLFWSAQIQRRWAISMKWVGLAIILWGAGVNWRVYQNRLPTYLQRMEEEELITKRKLKHEFEPDCYLHPHPERVQMDESIQELFH